MSSRKNIALSEEERKNGFQKRPTGGISGPRGVDRFKVGAWKERKGATTTKEEKRRRRSVNGARMEERI